MGTPGPDPSTTPTEIMAIFTNRTNPAAPLTAQEVADILGIAKRTAHKHLRHAEEETALLSKQVGGHARVWWVPYSKLADSTNSKDSHANKARES